MAHERANTGNTLHCTSNCVPPYEINTGKSETPRAERSLLRTTPYSNNPPCLHNNNPLVDHAFSGDEFDSRRIYLAVSGSFADGVRQCILHRVLRTVSRRASRVARPCSGFVANFWLAEATNANSFEPSQSSPPNTVGASPFIQSTWNPLRRGSWPPMIIQAAN
jgi:hypothetical protein